MPGRGKRGNGREAGGRNRGGASARGGRGKGRGSNGGRGRELIPSTMGYVYRPRSEVDEFNDDFRIYGQFSSDEDDSELETRRFVPHKQVNGKHRQKKDRLGFAKETSSFCGSHHNKDYDDGAMSHAGLGSSGSQNAAVTSRQQFANGKSKYLKKVLFTKSSSSVDLTKEAEDTLVEQHTDLKTSMSNLSLRDEKSLAKEELWVILKGNSPAPDDTSIEATCSSAELKDVELGTDIPKNDDTKHFLQSDFSPDEKEDAFTTNTSCGEDFVEQCTSDEEIKQDALDQDVEEGLLSDDEYYKDELKEGTLITEDFMENIGIEDEEDLEGLLAWSAMQESNLEFDLDEDEDEDEDEHEDGNQVYEYSTLDDPAAREIPLMKEEEMKITKNMAVIVKDDMPKRVGYRDRDENSIVDPEIFGQTLKAALADVPPGLRPGMRRWYEKQQRKDERKKKKEKGKALRKEEKKNGKWKTKDKEDEDLTNQMAKIDQRIRDFIQDDSISSFQFAPMATHVRRQLHVLAAAYNLKSKSAGGGGSRCTVVTKTPRTNIPNDRRYISRYLLDIQSNMDEQNRIIGKNNAKGNQKGKKKNVGSTKISSLPKDRRGDTQFPAGPSHGTIVAFDAAPISESNVGHRMLAAMGWKQGEALGSKSDGIIAPIEAIIRKKGRGLGS
ncbi:hypothetical protein [Parasitella parasitica]|uniref:Protein SQS1 n=1 Tax=Parasitella parasitica TaxID=35722 RepID=A0A0B7N1G4_9FUNG|nr:hypothetical protein [Parasitella parasitica]